ncbi:MAG: LacI family transcriptional regulator, partial [Pseudomonadota bacterium]
GMAGFNGVELIDGLPKRLATMDSCRAEIGKKAAELILASLDKTVDQGAKQVELSPVFAPGDTVR